MTTGPRSVQLRASLASWADLPRLDPLGLAALLGPPEPGDLLRQLIDLGARLPRGLIHAEAVHIRAEAPHERLPLAPSSAWYAVDQDLVVVVDTDGPDAVEALLADLADYAKVSAAVAEAGRTDPALVDAAQSDYNADTLRLLAALGTTEEAWRSLDARAPGLRDDLAVLLRQPFAAPIHLHPHVRPSWLAEAGGAWAAELRASCPVVRPWIIATEGPEAVDLLSPYVRDLTSALGQWAVENPDLIRVPGLRDAWTEAPDEDLAAMVVPDLLRSASDLNRERRDNERTQGLFLEDRLGVQAGFVELERLAAPDRLAVPEGTRGGALVAAGGPRPVWLAMVRAWLSEPFAGLATVLSAGTQGSTPVIPEVVADARDAFLLPGTPELLTDAASLGIDVTTAPVLELDGRWSTAAVDMLGQIRRGQLCGALDDDTPVYAAFTSARRGASLRSIELGRAALNATRLVLRRAFLPPSDTGQHGHRSSKTPRNTGVPRRFRA